MKKRSWMLVVPTSGPQMIFETRDPTTYALAHSKGNLSKYQALFANGKCIHPGVFDVQQLWDMEQQIAQGVTEIVSSMQEYA